MHYNREPRASWWRQERASLMLGLLACWPAGLLRNSVSKLADSTSYVNTRAIASR